MITYLTSHIGGSYKLAGKRFPDLISNENGLLDSLKTRWKENADILIISADADSKEINDSIRELFEKAFPMSGLSIKKIVTCDKRNEDIVQELLKYDVVILSGGHVPTQNAFFQKIRLKEKIQNYEGILIGISAGTMNCAEIVYAQPELEGESIDTAFQRFLPGLGVTGLMIIPHYQAIKDDMLDGKRLFEDITYPDSYEHEFYALTDGSYMVIKNGITTLYGEAYRIKDGSVEQICENNQRMEIDIQPEVG